MLDHLLPLISPEFEYFDEANKENFGYCIRRRARPVSSQVSTPSRTPPRPPRRTNSINIDGGVVSNRRLKRRRETSDDGSEKHRDAKKQHIRGDIEPIAKKKQVKQEKVAVKQKVNGEQRHMEPVSPLKKMQEPKMLAKKAAVKTKKSKKNKQTKVTEHSTQKKTIQVSKSVKPKRIPLQDITHLYVNDHTRSYPYQQRERFVAGLSTSVAIRFL
ncbi:hypothetical protein KXD40_006531 [Peronospora effusa]|nr:hypothetical protein KXD40_006531 [Peronospora effusa]